MKKWVIPPKQNGDFAAQMEDVLDIYHRSYDSDVPVLNMDEQPVQLIRDAHPAIPETLCHGKMIDYAYERCGTCSIFIFIDHMSSWCYVSVRERRTKRDFAEEMAPLLDGRYRDSRKLIVVCDNLNTHTTVAFYERYPPDVARRYAQRIEFHYTPKHGSFLNIAECELSVLTHQSLRDRCIGDIVTLRREVTAWSNEQKRGIEWRFTIEESRRKMHRIYPHV